MKCLKNHRADAGDDVPRSEQAHQRLTGVYAVSEASEHFKSRRVIKRSFRNVWSPERRNRRDVDIYLPASYSAGRERYPVVYMHDGQNLFDAAVSYSGEWQVDETMEALSAEGIEAIVVGIANKSSKNSLLPMAVFLVIAVS